MHFTSLMNHDKMTLESSSKVYPKLKRNKKSKQNVYIYIQHIIKKGRFGVSQGFNLID